jgi:hypothetical protein
LELTLTITGLLLAILGFFGCLLPVLPGPPLSYLALLVLSFARDWQAFSISFLVIAGLVAVLVSILDFLIPPAGAKRYGASRYGFWGSFIGMVLGLIFFSLPGMFIGGWAGAVGGELYAGKSGKGAMRAGWGVFLGNLVAIGLKMAFSAVVVIIYIKAMF